MSFDELRSIALWRRWRWLFVVDLGGVHFQKRSHHLVFQFHPFQTRHLLRARVQNVIIQPTGFIDAPQRVRGNLHRNHPVQNLRIQPLPFRVRGPFSSRFVPSILADVVPEPHGFPVVQPSFRAAARDEQVLEFRAELFRRVLRRHYLLLLCVFFFSLSLSLSLSLCFVFLPHERRRKKKSQEKEEEDEALIFPFFLLSLSHREEEEDKIQNNRECRLVCAPFFGRSKDARARAHTYTHTDTDRERQRERERERERRPAGFSEKEAPQRARKKSREREKNSRDTKKKEGKKKKKKCRRVECVACRRRPSSGARWDQSSRSW